MTCTVLQVEGTLENSQGNVYQLGDKVLETLSHPTGWFFSSSLSLPLLAVVLQENLTSPEIHYQHVSDLGRANNKDA